MRAISLSWALLAVACSTGGDDDPSMTKDEARRHGGKADDGRDWCEELGWYGDGVCDDFCPQPDSEDCGGCGGLAGTTCPNRQYCRYSSEQRCGAGDQMGVCSPRPDVCAEIYSPVCGCNGEEYGNTCEAARDGVSVAYEGECDAGGGGETCGGIAGLTCPEGQFCDYAPEASCGATDQSGTCSAIPEACIELYAPVCGCDGQQYGNACMAHAAGVAVASEGECGGGGGDDDCGGFAGLTCSGRQYCDYPDDAMCGVADQLGTCRARPDVCAEVYAPVCGCNGETYGNECEATRDGTDVASEGECGASDCRQTGCQDGDYCTYCWGNWACIPDGALC